MINTDDGKVLVRYDTTANWQAANPVLARGEISVASDTNILKIGDGVTSWSELASIGGDAVDYITETGSNEKGWWRRWKTGWLEQGGTLPTYSSTANRVVEMPQKFADLTYQVMFTWINASTNTSVDIRNFSTWDRTENTFTHRFGATAKMWHACGYGKEVNNGD